MKKNCIECEGENFKEINAKTCMKCRDPWDGGGSCPEIYCLKSCKQKNIDKNLVRQLFLQHKMAIVEDLSLVMTEIVPNY